MPNSWFEFKKFSVSHQKASFPVGTDACLLGAWVDVQNDGYILDIGTGSGVLALMAAQRSQANIFAIDMDASSVEQAIENFGASPWAQRLSATHKMLQTLDSSDLKMSPDHFLCNPPFFHASTRHTHPIRHYSRHDDAMPLELLFEKCASLSNDGSKLSVVYPYARWDEMQKTADKHGWQLSRALKIRPGLDKPWNRIMAEWHLQSDNDEVSNIQSLTLYDLKRDYTEEAKGLLSPYYLNL